MVPLRTSFSKMSLVAAQDIFGRLGLELLILSGSPEQRQNSGATGNDLGPLDLPRMGSRGEVYSDQPSKVPGGEDPEGSG